jgi:hypothetical protein
MGPSPTSYVHGRPVRESTGTADEDEAKRILRVREGQAAGRSCLGRIGSDTTRPPRTCALTPRPREAGISRPARCLTGTTA